MTEWITPRQFHEADGVERTVDTAADAMGSVSFDRARAEGRALALREAIDFALGVQPTR
jgi:hypothetical protein